MEVNIGRETPQKPGAKEVRNGFFFWTTIISHYVITYESPMNSFWCIYYIKIQYNQQMQSVLEHCSGAQHNEAAVSQCISGKHTENSLRNGEWTAWPWSLWITNLINPIEFFLNSTPMSVENH